MDGLLGTGWDDPKSQGLLALASGMLQGNMGAGVANMNTVMAGAQDKAMQRKLMDMQMQKGGLELEAEKRKLANEIATRDVLTKYYAPNGLPNDASPRAAPIPASPVNGLGAGLSAESMRLLPPEMQTPVTAAPPIAAPAMKAGIPPKSSKFDSYNKLGEQLAAAGQVEAAQRFWDLGEKYRPKYNTTPQQMMVNGKLTPVLVSEDGSTKDLNGYDVKPDMVEQKDGQTSTWVDKNKLVSGASFAMKPTPDAVMADTRSRNNNATTNAAHFAIAGLNLDGTPTKDMEKTAQAVAAGQLPAPTGMALTNPRNQRLLARVMEINPEYDFSNVTAKKTAATAFTSGPQGNALRSFAVAGHHLEQLGTLVDALGNRNLTVINAVANAYAKQTGNAAPTNFDAAKEVVAKEVIKAIVGGGGGVEERKELASLMEKGRSPAQLKGVITQLRNLMGAQHDALLVQRRAAGLSDATLPKYEGATPSPVPASAPAATVWDIQKVGQ